MKELNASKKKLIDEKEKFLTTVKDRIAQLDQETRQAVKEKDIAIDEMTKMSKQMVVVSNEREKLKEKIAKLKNRRNVDLNQKICKNCSKEYLENENYNWSCRTHRSEFGGEMWWCCGKTSKDAPGCKFSKHETKDEEEEEKEDEGGYAKNRRIKCICCKEVGHLARDCKREPNIRTDMSPEEELERIDQFKEFKRLNGDTFVFTQKLFENILVAKEREGSTNRGEVKSDPFQKKGAMEFDDYNYIGLNQMIQRMQEQSSLVQDEQDMTAKMLKMGAYAQGAKPEDELEEEQKKERQAIGFNRKDAAKIQNA